MSNYPDFVDLLRKEVSTESSSTPNRQEVRLQDPLETFYDGWDVDTWNDYVDEYCNGDKNQEGCFEDFLEYQNNKGDPMAKLWEFMAQMTFLSIANSLATYSAA